MSCKRTFSRRQGFTLVEMMVGLTLLGVMMSGVFASVRLSGLISESSIYENTAATIAQGYLEQIKSLPYEDVLLAAQSPESVVLNAMSPSYGSQQGSSIALDELSIDPDDQPNERIIQVDVRNDGLGTTINMPMKFWISISDLSVNDPPINALEIKIVYRYKLPDLLGGQWIEKQVQSIRSRV